MDSPDGNDWNLYGMDLLQAEEDDQENHALVSDSDGSYYYSDDEADTVQARYFHICSLTQVDHIRCYPRRYSRVIHFILSSFCFGEAKEMLNGIQRALIDQGCRSVRNFGRLEQADDLNTTLGRVYRKLLNVGRLFQQRLIDLDLPSSLSEFVQELALDGVHIQPPNVTNHVNAITIGLKAMIDSVSTATGGSVQFAGPVDYTELNHCAQYIMRRIKALGQQRVNYPSDVDPVEAFPQDDPRVPVLNGSEEEDKEGKEEEEQDFAETYVPYFDLDQLPLPDDEIDPEVHAWVSDSDDSCDQHDDDDNIMAQDILIRGLINLQYIRNFPKKYSHCQYYIIASFCFAGIPELLHGIREESEKLSWLWVGNMERFRQAYDIRATRGHICLDLDAIRKLLHCGQIDQVLVDSLAGSLMHLDFTSTSLQPHFIRYFVDNIATGLQDFLSAIPSDAAVVWAAEPPYLDDLAVLKSHLEFVTERVDALENQHAYYLKNIKRPELLPPCLGPLHCPSHLHSCPQNILEAYDAGS